MQSGGSKLLVLQLFCTPSKHSRKKRKESLEKLAEQVVLRAYVENQAILEPIFFYRASKYKQPKRPGY